MTSAIDEEIEKALTVWSEKHHLTTAHYPDIKTSQKSWDNPCAVKLQQKLLDQFDSPEDKARLLSISQEHASDWLLANPIPSLGLKLDNRTFRIACGLRLGSKVCHQHLCQCGKIVKPNGLHGLSCSKSCPANENSVLIAKCCPERENSVLGSI